MSGRVGNPVGRGHAEDAAGQMRKGKKTHKVCFFFWGASGWAGGRSSWEGERRRRIEKNDPAKEEGGGGLVPTELMMHWLL